MQDELVSTKTVSERLKVTVTTVNRWANTGRLVPAVEMPGETGARLYRLSEVEAFAASYLAPTEPSQASA